MTDTTPTQYETAGRCGRALSTGQPCPDHPEPPALRDRIARALAEITVGHRAFVTVDVQAEYPRADAVLAVLPEPAAVRAKAYRDAAALAQQWFGPDQGQLVAGWLLQQAQKQEPGPPYRCAHCGQEITAIPGRPEAYVWTGDVPPDGEWMKRYHLDTRFPECRAASGAFGLVQPAEQP